MHYACIMYHLLYMLLLWKWIKSNQINIHRFGLILIDYDLSKSVSKTELEVYN